MILSIVVPVYNVGRSVEVTVRSLAQQTIRDFEMIIIDDGSRDDSMTLVDRKLSLYPSLRYTLIRQEHGGVSRARNAGLQLAKGEYVMFLDSDDYVSPNLVQSVAQAASARRSDIICWRYKAVPSGLADRSVDPPLRSDITQIDYSGADSLRSLLGPGPLDIWTGSAAYRRFFVSQHSLAFTDGCVSGEDREFIFKAVARSNHVVFLSAILTFWVRREGSVTRSYSIRRFDAVPALLRAFDDLEALPDATVAGVAREARGPTVLGHFFYNLNSCILATDGRPSQLFEEIDGEYPLLMREMASQLKAASRLPIARRLFLVSPTVYSEYIRIRGAAYTCFQRLRRATGGVRE